MKRRAWWNAKQGLDGSLQGAAPEAVLAQTGWARSVGGAGPYLTLFARAGTSRAAADAAVAGLAIHELPSARGCTYVVPAADFALALKVGHPTAEGPVNQAKKYLDVTDAELERLYAAVLDALNGAGGAPLTPAQLKDACGGAVRNLGEAGKKRGVTSTLPLALGWLQAQGEIRRVPENGRLDQQRYAYARWEGNPLRGFGLSLEEAHVELARRYFRWIGPATLAEFQWFSGLGVGAAKKAVAPLGLVPVEEGSPFLLLPEELARWQAFEAASAGPGAGPGTGPGAGPGTGPALVSSLDAMLLLRRNLTELLDPGDRAAMVWAEKGGAQALGGLADSPFHVILDSGRLAGFWEYDPERQAIAWMTFRAPTEAVREAVARTEAFAREQLGDVRSFSLDSPASRAPRTTWLREHGR